MGTLNSVNERLDYLIKIKKMSDAKFMRETGTNNIGKMRSGKLAVTEGTISKICQSLGVSYDWLKYGLGNMNGASGTLLAFDPDKLGDKIREAMKRPLTKEEESIAMMFNVGDNSQNISTGTDRAKDDRIKLLEEKIDQLIQVINAKDETIRFLKALLKANKIDY